MERMLREPKKSTSFALSKEILDFLREMPAEARQELSDYPGYISQADILEACVRYTMAALEDGDIDLRTLLLGYDEE